MRPSGQTTAVAVDVTVVVTEVRDAESVFVIAVIFQQTQAVLYLAVPEHAVAYIGTASGTFVICRANFGSGIVVVTFCSRVTVAVTLAVAVTVKVL